MLDTVPVHKDVNIDIFKLHKVNNRMIIIKCHNSFNKAVCLVSSKQVVKKNNFQK